VMRGDVRSFQVAVVPDSRLDGLLELLEEERWGVIQLPPSGLDPATASAWLEQVAEHVAEFRRNDYAVVLVDEGQMGTELDAALAELGVAPLPRVACTREGLRQYAIQPPSTSRLTPET
jgi:hypothetical protein